MENWKEYLSEHLIKLTNKFYCLKTINSLKMIFHENNFYLHLLKTNNNNSSYFENNRVKEKCFVDIAKFNNFVFENIFDLGLESIPRRVLDAYSGKNYLKKDGSISLRSLKINEMNLSSEKQNVQTLDL